MNKWQTDSGFGPAAGLIWVSATVMAGRWILRLLPEMVVLAQI
jgi:hypothetical protein